MRNGTSLLVVLLLALGACSGEKKEGKGGAAKSGEKGRKADEGDKFAIERATANLAEARHKVKAGEDTEIACAAVTGYTDQLKGVEGASKLIADAEKLCGYEAPLAIIKREVEKTEKARAAKPDDKLLSECYNASYDMALETLEKKYAGDPTLAKLKARFAKACPKSE